MTRVTVADVRRAYPATRIAEHKVTCPYSYYVLGEVSLRLTPPFINAGCSANAVTGLAFASAIAALGVTVLGAYHPGAFLGAGLLFHVVYLLDNIDGHIARFRGETSLLGGMLDALVTWVHKALFPIALGLALVHGGVGEVPFFDGAMPAWVWLAAGGTRSFAFLFMVALGRKTDALLVDREDGVRPIEGVAARAARTVEEVEPLLLILAVFFGIVGPLHLFYAGFGVLILAVTTVLNLRRLRRADQMAAG